MGRRLLLITAVGAICLSVALLDGPKAPFSEEEATPHAAQLPPENASIPLQTLDFLELPADITGTTLVAERLVCYEGPFIENGSGAPVTNTAALVIRNTGDAEVLTGEAVLTRAGERYVFSFSHIFPGMAVMVLEQENAAYFQDGITACSGWAEVTADTNLLDRIRITPLDMGTLEITNISSETLQNLKLYHKNYLPDGTFVGGITYETSVGSLGPGESAVICPEFYADGYSRIFKGQTE